jgi:CO/xanthine dehydrogenase Mo-binding subunit
MTSVGRSVSRKDGIGKATGRAKYADDIVFPGMLYGRTIRSTIARGTVCKVRKACKVRLAFDTTGFTSGGPAPPARRAVRRRHAASFP